MPGFLESLSSGVWSPADLWAQDSQPSTTMTGDGPSTSPGMSRAYFDRLYAPYMQDDGMYHTPGPGGLDTGYQKLMDNYVGPAMLAIGGGAVMGGAVAGGMGAAGGVEGGFAGDIGTFPAVEGANTLGSTASGSDLFGTDPLASSASSFSMPPADPSGMNPGMTETGSPGFDPSIRGPSSMMDNLTDLWKKYQALTKSPIGSAFNIGSSIYNMMQGRNLQQLARTASSQQDPFASQRGQYQRQLAELTSTGDVTKLPGYAAGLEAVNRGAAAGGYLGSGNQVIANSTYGSNLYNQTVAQLSQLAGGNLGTGGAGNTLLQGNIAGTQLQGNALNRLGMGASQLFSSFG